MNRSHLQTGVAAVMAALALAASAAAPAAAVAPAAPAFALTSTGQPGAILMRGAPGRVLHGGVIVRNTTARRVEIRLQPADIRTAANGNADYVTTHISQNGEWLHLGATTVQLRPHAVRSVGYAVRVPRSARGGSHYAGIVAVDAAELAAAARKPRKGKSFSFRRVNRQALPLTVRLPGPRTRSLALRSLRIKVAPAGAGLVLDLLPGGSELIERAPVKLRVSRGSRTILTHDSALGQLFPGAGLAFRIPWVGRPTEGEYRVKGVIRPHRAAPIFIDQMIRFSSAKASQLESRTAPVASGPGTPLWMWVALGVAGLLLALLLFLLWRLRRRPVEQVA